MSSSPSPDDARSPGEEQRASKAGGEAEVSAASVDSAFQDAGSGPQGDADQPPEELAELQKQVLRAQAELENYRKRSQREMEQQRKYAILGVVRDLSPALDNLQRAIAASANETSNDALRQGVQMVVQLMLQTLEQHGCRQVGEVGEAFDPNFHEAVGQEASDTLDKGKVARVMQVGYMLHDRVVRPAQVFVSSGPAS